VGVGLPGIPANCKKYAKKNFISIHKPPASIRFAPIKHALAVSVEPFKFSPAEPVAYELSYRTGRIDGYT
jgi:hypothetical protein